MSSPKVNYEQIMLAFFLEHNIHCESKQFNGVLRKCNDFVTPKGKKMTESYCKGCLQASLENGDFKFYEQSEEEEDKDFVPNPFIVESEPTAIQSLLMGYGCSEEMVGLPEPEQETPVLPEEEDSEEETFCERLVSESEETVDYLESELRKKHGKDYNPFNMNEDSDSDSESEEEEEPATKEMGTQTDNSEDLLSSELGFAVRFIELEKKYKELQELLTVRQKDLPPVQRPVQRPVQKKKKKVKELWSEENKCHARIWVEMNDTGVRNAIRARNPKVKYFSMPNYRCSSACSEGSDYCSVHTKKNDEGELWCGDCRDPPEDYVQEKSIKGEYVECLHAFVGYDSGKGCIQKASVFMPKTKEEFRDKSAGKFKWIPEEWRHQWEGVASPHDPLQDFYSDSDSE